MANGRPLVREKTLGSRRHVLDWVESPRFRAEFNDVLKPTGAVVGPTDHVLPVGWEDAREARLETFGPDFLPTAVDWQALTQWWLKYPTGANTPNWDIAATCKLRGQSALVLVEAKAHGLELAHSGKSLSRDASSLAREPCADFCGNRRGEKRLGRQGAWGGNIRGALLSAGQPRSACLVARKERTSGRSYLLGIHQRHADGWSRRCDRGRTKLAPMVPRVCRRYPSRVVWRTLDRLRQCGHVPRPTDARNAERVSLSRHRVPHQITRWVYAALASLAGRRRQGKG